MHVIPKSSTFIRDAAHIGKTDDDEVVHATIFLRRRPGHIPLPKFEDYVDCPARPRISTDEFGKRHGASPDEIAAIISFCARNHLKVKDAHIARRQVRITGSVAQFNAAFNLEIHTYERTERKLGTYRFRAHDNINIPEELSDFIIGVMGIGDGRRPHHFLDVPVVTNALNPIQVLPIYNFISDITTTNQTIGIFGTGLLENDYVLTMNAWGFIDLPKITNIYVDEGTNPGGSAEGTVDVATAAAFGPAGVNLVVYYPNDSISTYFADVVSRMVHPEPGDPICDILSFSVGYSGDIEADPSFMESIDQFFEDAAAQSITVFISSGDNGSQNNSGVSGDGGVFLTYPAGSAWVTAVGGTVLGCASGTIGTSNFQEWVWNDDPTTAGYGASGGGISTYWPVPSYQASVTLPVSLNTGGTGRGVPDIAGNASPQSCYLFYVNGSAEQIGGTSVSTPMYAGQMASINTQIGKNAGFINPSLYKVGSGSSSIRDIVTASGSANNNATSITPGYPVTVGWDACTGLGVINGNNFATYLSNTPAPTYIYGISLSSTSISEGAASGTVVGAIQVNVTGTPFSGSLTLSGTNAGAFQIINSNLCIKGVVPQGTYSITLTATQTTNADGSPFSQTFAISATASTLSLVGAKAPNSQFWLLRDNGLAAGQSIANAYLPLPTGNPFWNWLFYQASVAFQTPGAVSSVMLTAATTTSINVSWIAPTTGTSPFTYQVYYSTTNTGPWIQFTLAGVYAITSTSLTIGPVTTGNNYWVQIIAVSADDLLIGPATIQGPVLLGTLVNTVLNTADKSSSITLSNGSLTATSSGAVPQSVRSTLPILNGKAYFEVTLNAPTNNISVGLSLVTYPLNQPNGLGFDVFADSQIGWNAVGYIPTSTYLPGQIVAGNDGYVGECFTQSVGTTSNGAGAIVGIAVDMTLPYAQIYFTSTGMHTDGNAWNNMPLSECNPATGINGYPMNVIQPGPWFATFYSGDSASQVTFNFGESAFAFPVPVGFSSYDAVAIPYTTPNPAIGVPQFLNTASVSSSTVMPLSWQAPATGTGPFTYNLETCSPSQLYGDLVLTYWQSLASGTTSLTYNYSIPSFLGEGFPIWFRIQAITSTGVSQWSSPVLTIVPGSASASNPIVTNLFYPATYTSSMITYAHDAIPPDPDSTPQEPSNYIGAFIPNTPANAFVYLGLEIEPNVSFGSSVYVNGGNSNINLTDTSFYASPLAANTEYILFSYFLDQGLPTRVWSSKLMSLPATGTFSGGFTNRLVPQGTILMSIGNQNQFVVVEAGNTAHFAIYYDYTVYTSTQGASTASSVLSGLETIYSQCETWFGSQPALWPALKTSINPVGKLINVILSAGVTPTPGGTFFAVASPQINSADLICNTAHPSDLGVVSFIQMLVATQLVSYFMLSLSGTSTGYITAFAQGLQYSMSASLFPSAAVNNSTTSPVVAYYLDSVRVDYVNTNINVIDNPFNDFSVNPQAIGCNALFITYLVTQLGYTYTEICTALNTLPANCTAGQVYNVLNSTINVDPFPAFASLLQANCPYISANGMTPGSVPTNFPIDPWPMTSPPATRHITVTASSTASTVTLSGTLSGYTGPPVLTFSFDGGQFSNSFDATTATTYSYTSNITVPSGSYTVIVTDTINTSGTGPLTVS